MQRRTDRILTTHAGSEPTPIAESANCRGLSSVVRVRCKALADRARLASAALWRRAA